MTAVDAIDTLLNHRSVRKFTTEPVTDQTVHELIKAATHGSSSMFMQQYSIISVTNGELLGELEEVTGHNNALHNSHVFMFIVDQHRNATIAKENGVDTTLLGETDRLIAGIDDATIAAQSMLVAAENMNLGGRILRWHPQ